MRNSSRRSQHVKTGLRCMSLWQAIAPRSSRAGSYPRLLQSTRRFWRFKRRGVAAVEFAVIAPLFVLIVMGLIEFGRGMMVKQIITNAAREGARRAIIESATESEVKSVVNQYLAGASISGATVSVTPTSLSTLGLGDAVTVQVSVSCNSVSWTPSPWFLGGRTLTESSTMRAERLQ
jgi:Flp pilus assembly protein TadG